MEVRKKSARPARPKRAGRVSREPRQQADSIDQLEADTRAERERALLRSPDPVSGRRDADFSCACTGTCSVRASRVTDPDVVYYARRGIWFADREHLAHYLNQRGEW